MTFQKKMIPCSSREAIVTVGSYKDGVLHGYLQHPRLKQGEELRSLSQMILLLDGLIDLEDCPGSPLPLVRQESHEKEAAAILRIRVFSREHGVWQGKLIWQEEGREYIFHSVIELLRLLDEILAE